MCVSVMTQSPFILICQHYGRIIADFFDLDIIGVSTIYVKGIADAMCIFSSRVRRSFGMFVKACTYITNPLHSTVSN